MINFYFGEKCTVAFPSLNCKNSVFSLHEIPDIPFTCTGPADNLCLRHENSDRSQNPCGPSLTLAALVFTGKWESNAFRLAVQVHLYCVHSTGPSMLYFLSVGPPGLLFKWELKISSGNTSFGNNILKARFHPPSVTAIIAEVFRGP